MLIVKFRSINVETFFEFYSKFSDIVNSNLNLRKIIPRSKMIRKIFKSLLERLRLKRGKQI